MDEPRSFYLEQKWGSDERIYINVTIKSDINESLRMQLKDLDKKLVLYSRAHTYRIDEFGEDSLRPNIQKTHFEVADDFNELRYEYTHQTLVSEEAWLGVDIFGQNKEQSWWELEETPKLVRVNQDSALLIRI